MTNPLSDTTITLMKARDILEKGWCQGALQDGERHCILGSIRAVLGLPMAFCSGDFERRYCSAVDAVSRIVSCPANFNDDPNRTHSEVLDVMDQAIQRSMKEG